MKHKNSSMEVILDFKKGEMMGFLTRNGYQIFFHNYQQFDGPRDKEGWYTTVYFAINTKNGLDSKSKDFLTTGYMDLDYLSAISHEYELSNAFKKLYKSKLLNL